MEHRLPVSPEWWPPGALCPHVFRHHLNACRQDPVLPRTDARTIMRRCAASFPRQSDTDTLADGLPAGAAG